jgi:hypothetical protein
VQRTKIFVEKKTTKIKQKGAAHRNIKLNNSNTQPAILLGFQNLAGFSYPLKQNRNQENEKDIPNGLYLIAIIDFTAKDNYIFYKFKYSIPSSKFVFSLAKFKNFIDSSLFPCCLYIIAVT